MIKSITVKNYILIDELTLEFNEGFNVFTGETGAGKSIIIGAIDAALGAKTSKEVIKQGSDKACIELLIKINDGFNKELFEENGIEISNNEIIISREILVSTSRYRVNGILVSQDFIKDIRENLIDIHSQHQSYNYIQPKNHIILLDNFALKPHRDNIELFSSKYFEYIENRKRLDFLISEVERTKQQEEFLKFQIEEIESAHIEDVNECETLEKELSILSNAEKLKELSYSSYWTMNGDDGNILSVMSDIKSNISKLAQMDDSVVSIEENFINAYETIKDISYQLRDYSENKECDNERIDFIGERLSLLEKLKRKYGNSLEDVLNKYDELSKQLEAIEISQDEIVETEKKQKELEAELTSLSEIITNARKELASVLSKAVTEKLEKLELPKAKFEIKVEDCSMNERGKDRVEFYISTNVSEPLRPLAKTASGGEISRIMLAIKSIFAQADKTSTVIFDEIDTGISGKASQSVADEITFLSKTHQVIIITHQPIIAAKADCHFYVKKEQAETTKVTVYNLQNENRVKALALLSAGEINEESESFARNLLKIN